MISAALAVAAFAAQASIDDAQPYRALGNEPSWSVMIGSGQIVFASPGRPSLTVTAPAPQNDQGTINYNARDISISIIPVPCDPIGGRRYAHSVFVTVGRDQFSGCGGEVLAADSLAGTSWVFAEVAGEPVALTGDLIRDSAYMIDFSEDGFVGYGGCNRFAARYSRAGDMMTPGPLLGRTVRNCGPSVTGRETRLLQILLAPTRISFPDRRRCCWLEVKARSD